MPRSDEFIGDELFDSIIVEALNNSNYVWGILLKKNGRYVKMTSKKLIKSIIDGTVTRQSFLHWQGDTFLCLDDVRPFHVAFNRVPHKPKESSGCGCLILIIVAFIVLGVLTQSDKGKAVFEDVKNQIENEMQPNKKAEND